MTGAIGIGSVAVIAGGIGRLLQNRFDIGGERAALDLPTAASPVTAASGHGRTRRHGHHAVRDPERQLLPDRHRARGAAGLEGLVEV